MKKKTEKSTLSKEVSIILPTFNEAGNVVKLIELIERLTKNISWKVYYLVVDDDSKDETQNLVKKIGKKK